MLANGDTPEELLEAYPLGPVGARREWVTAGGRGISAGGPFETRTGGYTLSS